MQDTPTIKETTMSEEPTVVIDLNEAAPSKMKKFWSNHKFGIGVTAGAASLATLLLLVPTDSKEETPEETSDEEN